MKKMSLEFEGTKVSVIAERIGNTLWYHYNGETYSFLPETKQRGGLSGKAATGELKAPMPGKIVKVEVSVGQSISRGDTVIVMEAMKMEYAIEAGVSGIVSRVNFKIGDQVTLGAELAFIDATEEGE